ncbi:MAG: heavy-metal-associated domain-containing protein [Clostridium sp.]|nr:heavy-metal-associated domain-containing protein [Clostridium sp.]
MKSIIKVHGINAQKDVVNIQKTIATIEGILACEISIKKKEIQVIYNDSCINLDDITESIENLGYMTI